MEIVNAKRILEGRVREKAGYGVNLDGLSCGPGDGAMAASCLNSVLGQRLGCGVQEEGLEGQAGGGRLPCHSGCWAQILLPHPMAIRGVTTGNDTG